MIIFLTHKIFGSSLGCKGLKTAWHVVLSLGQHILASHESPSPEQTKFSLITDGWLYIFVQICGTLIFLNVKNKGMQLPSPSQQLKFSHNSPNLAHESGGLVCRENEIRIKAKTAEITFIKKY